jgi:hypothetical protein
MEAIMSDWRSKPRNGKAQFLKHLPMILTRVKAGETQNAIRQDLERETGLSISKAQFSRYLKAFNQVENSQAGSKPPSSDLKPRTVNKPADQVSNQASNKASVEKPASPRKPMTPADFRKIREDVDKMDLDALIRGDGIVYRE